MSFDQSKLCMKAADILVGSCALVSSWPGLFLVSHSKCRHLSEFRAHYFSIAISISFI